MGDRRKLLSLLGCRSYVSERGLAEVLKQVNANPQVLESCSRSSIKRARQDQVRTETPLGPLIRSIEIQSEGHGLQRLLYVHPVVMLTHAASHCSEFARFLAARLQETPSTPDNKWTVVVYSDEISPGNPLKGKNWRKTQAVYWSLKEFKAAGLCCESLWFVLTVIRSDTAKKLGGMSVLFRYLLDTFVDVECNLFHGVMFNLSGQTHLLFATPGLMVSDESALKQCMGCKGASGVLCCMFCKNLINTKIRGKTNFDKFDSTGTLVAYTETDVGKFILRTDNSVIEIVTMFQREFPNMTKGAFEELETTMGFNFIPEGLLLSSHFGNRSISMLMTDWFHIYLVHGIFNIECGLLLDLLKRHAGGKAVFTRLDRFMQQIEWPAQFRGGGHASHVFSGVTRDKPGDQFKCSGSQGLSLYGPLRLFLHLYIFATAHPVLKAACVCFFALCDVLDLLQVCAKGGVSPRRLLDVIVTHLRYFQQLYETHWIPKCHFALHLALLLELHGVLISCFVHERKHKEIKRFVNNYMDYASKGFEKGIIEGVLLVHLETLNTVELPSINEAAALSSPLIAGGELKRVMQDAFNTAAEVYTAVDAVVKGIISIHRGDVAIAVINGQQCVAKVWFHVQIGGMCMSCVCPWPMFDKTRCCVRNEPLIIATDDMSEVVAYFLDGDFAHIIRVRG
jgi:hypothetical protein